MTQEQNLEERTQSQTLERITVEGNGNCFKFYTTEKVRVTPIGPPKLLVLDKKYRRSITLQLGVHITGIRLNDIIDAIKERAPKDANAYCLEEDHHYPSGQRFYVFPLQFYRITTQPNR